MYWSEEQVLSCFLCLGQKEVPRGMVQGAKLGGPGKAVNKAGRVESSAPAGDYTPHAGCAGVC